MTHSSVELLPPHSWLSCLAPLYLRHPRVSALNRARHRTHLLFTDFHPQNSYNFPESLGRQRSFTARNTNNWKLNSSYPCSKRCLGKPLPLLLRSLPSLWCSLVPNSQPFLFQSSFTSFFLLSDLALPPPRKLSRYLPYKRRFLLKGDFRSPLLRSLFYPIISLSWFQQCLVLSRIDIIIFPFHRKLRLRKMKLLARVTQLSRVKTRIQVTCTPEPHFVTSQVSGSLSTNLSLLSLQERLEVLKKYSPYVMC